MLSWHIVTSEQYRLGEKVDGDLYFLRDTKEIYRGTESYTETIVLYDEEPTVKAVGKLYVSTKTLEGKTWDGEKWTTIIKPIDDTIELESESGNPVSGKAVAAFVAQEIAKVPTIENAVTDIDWDAETGLLSYTQNGSPKTVLLSGVAVDMKATAEGKSTTISLLDKEGNPVGNSISLDLERFVTGAEYDAEKKSIFLYFDGKTGEESTDKLEIPVGDLVDTYTVESGETLTLEMEGTVIKGEVKISEESDNALIIKPDGLYVAKVDVSDKMDLVDGATEGNIAVYGTGGQIVDTGLTKDKIIEEGKIKVYFGETIEEIKEQCQEIPAAQGDLGIVGRKAPGNTGMMDTRKIHVFDKGTWKAITGSLPANYVYLEKDLVITSELPGIKLVNGNATVAKAGDSLSTALDKLFKHERAPQITKPSLSVTLYQAGEYEVGTSVTPSFEATLDPGAYEFGPEPTGVVSESWNVSDSNSNMSTTNTGSFDAFNVAEGTNYAVTVINQYTAGQIPVTNLGNNYADGQIKTGTLTAVSKNITGYRAAFGGAKTTKGDEVTTDYIRALATKVKPVKGKSFEINVPAGTMRVVVAIPGTFADPKAIKDGNAMGLNIFGNFKGQTISVEGANGYLAVPYKVYVLDMAAASLQDNVYTVIL